MTKQKHVKSRKFTDKELLHYYKKGISDIKISKIFGCCSHVIYERRCKLGLVANFKSFGGKRNSKKELLRNYDTHINEIKIGNKSGGKYFKRRKKYMKNFDSTEERKEIKRKYHHIPKVSKKEKKIRNAPEFKEKRAKYHKQYWINNREKLSKYNKKAYLKRKSEKE